MMLCHRRARGSSSIITVPVWEQATTLFRKGVLAIAAIEKIGLVFAFLTEMDGSWLGGA